MNAVPSPTFWLELLGLVVPMLLGALVTVTLFWLWRRIDEDDNRLGLGEPVSPPPPAPSALGYVVIGGDAPLAPACVPARTISKAQYFRQRKRSLAASDRIWAALERELGEEGLLAGMLESEVLVVNTCLNCQRPVGAHAISDAMITPVFSEAACLEDAWFDAPQVCPVCSNALYQQQGDHQWQ
jgi:hypothetical protein